MVTFSNETSSEASSKERPAIWSTIWEILGETDVWADEDDDEDVDELALGPDGACADALKVAVTGVAYDRENWQLFDNL